MLERTRVEKNPKIIENFKNNFTKSSSKQYYDLAKSLWDCIENSSYYYREPEDKFLNMIKKYYNCHYYEIKNMDELLSGPLKNALELHIQEDIIVKGIAQINLWIILEVL